MAEWLLEIFSEEIPSRMQKGAQEQLGALAKAHLLKEGLSFNTIHTFVTPRRLTLVVEGLPLRTPEKIEEKRGPRIDASPAALEGFLKGENVRREDCVVKETPKGNFLFVVKKEPGGSTPEILSSLTPRLLEQFRWAKSMRWGNISTPWVRPIRNFLSLFEGNIVPFSYAGVNSSNQTQGHRFLAPGPFTVHNFEDYQEKLRKHFVILDWNERRSLIHQGMTQIAQESNLKLLEDEALLDEVAGLVEWPVPLKGAVDSHFMNLPREVITTPMRVHQRYFPFENANGKLAPTFGVVANLETRDKGKTIVIGNERVLRARLADAQFFWEQDQKKPLETYNTNLKTRLFHQQLGSLFDKVERLIKLSSHIAKTLKADPQTMKWVERAALLSKADLASHMVGEFPELQGIMGRYYAQNQGEASEVSQAIEEHYWPINANDKRIPTTIESIILAIADRIDTLVGFFAIGIIPSGSKDPFALRRAGHALIRLCRESEKLPEISILNLLEKAYDTYEWSNVTPPHLKSKEETVRDLWKFLIECYKFWLKAFGVRHDYIDAVLGVADEDSNFKSLHGRAASLVLNSQLQQFSQNNLDLLTAYKRAANILKIESTKDKKSYEEGVREDLLIAPEEKQLFTRLSEESAKIQALAQEKKYSEAIQRLATLRDPVDLFFDKVMVNVKEDAVRTNRLHLLALLRKTFHQVADFSKIEG